MVFRREALLVGAGVAILFDALLVWQEKCYSVLSDVSFHFAL